MSESYTNYEEREETPMITGYRNIDALSFPEKSIVWSFARTVRLLASIDIIFTFLYGLYYWPLLFIGLLPFCGYIGARKYNSCLISMYLLFNLFNIIGRSIVIYYAYTRDDYTIRTIDMVIYSIGIIVNMWVSYIIVKLIRRINKLEDVYLLELRSGWEPERIVWVYY